MDAAERSGLARFKKTGLPFRSCVLILAIVWMWAGVWKVLNWTAFVSIVDGHGVTPRSVLGLIWIVPAVEVALGVALACLASPGGNRSSALGWIVASAVALAGATVYVWMVPAQVIQTLGCGCRPSLLSAGTSLGERSGTLAINAVMFGLHLACLRLSSARNRTSAMPSA